MANETPSGSSGRRWGAIVEVVVQVAIIAAAATLIYTSFFSPTRAQSPGIGQLGRRPEAPLPTAPVSLEGAATKGDPRAKVALIEYSDFQCPFCGRFARETLPKLEEKYIRAGKVLLAFRHLPLAIHAHAQKAAEAAECAGEQGMFWPMHDLLFQDPEQLAESSLRNSAGTLRLDRRQFQSCLGGRLTAKIQADAEAGRALGITATPTFLVGSLLRNGQVKVEGRIPGAQGFRTFEAALNKLLLTSSREGQ